MTFKEFVQLVRKRVALHLGELAENKTDDGKQDLIKELEIQLQNKTQQLENAFYHLEAASQHIATLENQGIRGYSLEYNLSSAVSVCLSSPAPCPSLLF